MINIFLGFVLKIFKKSKESTFIIKDVFSTIYTITIALYFFPEECPQGNIS